MKKIKAHVAQGKLAKPQKSVGEKLDAPVVLTPEQLETVAGGFIPEITYTRPTTFGGLPVGGLSVASVASLPVAGLLVASVASSTEN